MALELISGMTKRLSARLQEPANLLTVALVLGAGVRLAALLIVPDPDFPDARAYRTAGRELLENGTMYVHTYMPLYPIWTYFTGGGWTSRLVDVGLSIATIWAIWAVSLDVYADRGAAALTSLAAAVYPHFIFYSISGLTETAFVLLMLLSWIAAYRGQWFAASIAIVMSILVRPAMDLFGPLLLAISVLVVRREPPRVLAKVLVIYAIVYVVLMSPWWVHNYQKYDRFVRLNLGDGLVLYSGNNPINVTGGGVIETIDNTDVDLRPFVGIADPYARNEALKKAAWDYIVNNPVRTLQLAGLKFVRFWRLWPFSPHYSSPWIIIVSLASYGVMLALSIIGLAFWLRRFWRPLAAPLLFAAYLTAVHMITIGSIRYRLPLEPFILIIGCHALAQFATGPVARYWSARKSTSI